MNRKLIAIIMVMGILTSGILFCFRPAFAISNGVIDGKNYPNVGALIIGIKGPEDVNVTIYGSYEKLASSYE